MQMTSTACSGQRHGYFELVFRPSWGLVSVVRRFVMDFFQEVVGDRDATARMALAAHELLENAVKYSTNGETLVSIEVSGQGPRRRCVVVTRNRTAPEHAAVAAQALQQLAAEPDAFSYYQRLMQQAARASGSGLGLARIRAEAEMSMSHRLEGEYIRVQAEAEIDVEKGR
jgi:hypothetical protein